MNIKEYSEVIQGLASLFPNAEIIYSKDDEGNNYKPVHFYPAAGRYIDGEFQVFGDADIIITSKEVNAICVN